jgi:hypothetical protein
MVFWICEQNLMKLRHKWGALATSRNITTSEVCHYSDASELYQ